jgi:hypothetical protein
LNFWLTEFEQVIPEAHILLVSHVPPRETSICLHVLLEHVIPDEHWLLAVQLPPRPDVQLWDVVGVPPVHPEGELPVTLLVCCPFTHVLQPEYENDEQVGTWQDWLMQTSPLWHAPSLRQYAPVPPVQP